jgi:hypothetical protein
MKMFVNPTGIFLHRDFVDFRNAINGLTALVEDEQNEMPIPVIYLSFAINQKIN